jgi:hypothetical protein
VTLLPFSAPIDNLPRPRAGCARISIQHGQRMAAIDVGDAELDRGILIGRADKCRDDGLRAVLDNSVSRAHLLVLREKNVVRAFDLASTQGTYSYGTRVRRVALPDTGATLALGTNPPVHLHWVRRA